MTSYLRAVLASAVLAVLYAVPAHAQATRTWVSGVGDDVNPCSRTAPCKTFAGTISKTAPGGEINCLDPGGFGGLTITKAIAIICDYTEGGVLVAGTNAFVVAAGAADNVYLSGLDIDGLNSTGASLNGVKIISAASVHIVNSTIRGFTAGTPDGNAILVAPTAGSVKVFIENVRMDVNGLGVEVRPSGSASANVTIERSFANNSSHAGFRANATATSGPVTLMVTHSQASGNVGAGVVAVGATAAVKVGYSTFANNAGGDIAASAGMLSFGNNQVSDGSVPALTPLR